MASWEQENERSARDDAINACDEGASVNGHGGAVAVVPNNQGLEQARGGGSDVDWCALTLLDRAGALIPGGAIPINACGPGGMVQSSMGRVSVETQGGIISSEADGASFVMGGVSVVMHGGTSSGDDDGASSVGVEAPTSTSACEKGGWVVASGAVRHGGSSVDGEVAAINVWGKGVVEHSQGGRLETVASWEQENERSARDGAINACDEGASVNGHGGAMVVPWWCGSGGAKQSRVGEGKGWW